MNYTYNRVDNFWASTARIATLLYRKYNNCTKIFTNEIQYLPQAKINFCFVCVKKDIIYVKKLDRCTC